MRKTKLDPIAVDTASGRVSRDFDWRMDSQGRFFVDVPSDLVARIRGVNFYSGNTLSGTASDLRKLLAAAMQEAALVPIESVFVIQYRFDGVFRVARDATDGSIHPNACGLEKVEWGEHGGHDQTFKIELSAKLVCRLKRKLQGKDGFESVIVPTHCKDGKIVVMERGGELPMGTKLPQLPEMPAGPSLERFSEYTSHLGWDFPYRWTHGERLTNPEREVPASEEVAAIFCRAFEGISAVGFMLRSFTKTPEAILAAAVEGPKRLGF